eukprot:490575-Amphidinium_carterae.1
MGHESHKNQWSSHSQRDENEAIMLPLHVRTANIQRPLEKCNVSYSRPPTSSLRFSRQTCPCNLLLSLTLTCMGECG